MSNFINIGFGNMVNAERVLAVIKSDSAPAKRLIANGKENQSIIDATQGRKTKSIIITDTDKIMLSALMSETITSRIKNPTEGIEEK